MLLFDPKGGSLEVDTTFEPIVPKADPIPPPAPNGPLAPGHGAPSHDDRYNDADYAPIYPSDRESSYKKLPESSKRGLRQAFALAKKATPGLTFLYFLGECFDKGLYELIVPVKLEITLNGWTMCAAYSACTKQPTHQSFYLDGNCQTGSACLLGQAKAVTLASGYDSIFPFGIGNPLPAKRVNWLSNVRNVAQPGQQAAWRADHVRQFARSVTSSTLPAQRTVTVLGPNANTMRQVQTSPQPMVRQATVTRADSHTRTRVAVRMWPGGTAPPPLKPHTSTAPAKNEKHRKGRAQRIGGFLATSLDTTSEWAEQVAAIYDTLPADVRKRWGCAKLNRPGDNMGQYGLGAADCMLKALYHNWHKIDPKQSIVNLMYNEIEDKLYGTAYRARSRVRPRNLAINFGGIRG
jgi:hypothetical protein